MLPHTLVTLATYNERDNLAPLLKEIHHVLPHADVLIIDDASPDGTGQVADELAAHDPRIRVLHRPGKLGLGTATLAAMRFAMLHDYEYMINMDADFSHHPRYLPALVDGMETADIMIGSRYVPDGATENWPLTRRLISRCVNLLVRFLMRIPARDCSGAYRCYRVSMLRQVALDRVLSRGYSFQQEVLYRCRLTSCRIGEIPILFENRRAGVTKVNLGEMVRSFSLILYLGIQAFLGLNPALPRTVQIPSSPGHEHEHEHELAA